MKLTLIIYEEEKQKQKFKTEITGRFKRWSRFVCLKVAKKPQKTAIFQKFIYMILQYIY